MSSYLKIKIFAMKPWDAHVVVVFSCSATIVSFQNLTQLSLITLVLPLTWSIAHFLQHIVCAFLQLNDHNRNISFLAITTYFALHIDEVISEMI